ncbi:Uncharacterised protein [Anaerobiospirillum thomasii]|uniref:Uncharacterized protein n=1 Tax=Anaerobiospirillum thomasii TaxID=179995 RepID=A0A2X0VTU7_9GAMM|nr:hypothetical protein [Anaerobiospirillum thomasii]SPT68924.1 Uncharacterised protein [Anaerobiospirillum thomasii]SPT71160.1 Uncharacterised protein [Anaerobiospirillum thomasii]
MLYMLNSNSSLLQCREIIERTDSVVVFKEEDIDESIVLSLCDKCESIRIVDSNFFIERKKNNKGEENSAISSKLICYRVKAREAAIFISNYKGQVVSLL